MKLVINYILVFAISITFASCELNAQDFGIFSGGGIPSKYAQKTDVPKKPLIRWPKMTDFTREYQAPKEPLIRWPKMTDFTKDDSTEQTARPFSSLFKKPSFEFLKRKPNLFGGDSGEGAVRPFAGLADLMPKRDPNKPSFFAQMNAKSKSLMDRTTGKIASWGKKAEEPQAKAFGTWDAVTRDMRSIQAKQNGIQPTVPAQPNIRTADAVEKPRVRF
ncbi:MAG: hypothetical protein AB8B55_18595 [Mariniblastus sp.]